MPFRDPHHGGHHQPSHSSAGCPRPQQRPWPLPPARSQELAAAAAADHSRRSRPAVGIGVGDFVGDGSDQPQAGIQPITGADCSCSSASQRRPGRAEQGPQLGMTAKSASRACSLDCTRERMRTSRRASRASGGAIQASASRLVPTDAPEFWSTASFVARAAEMALVASGWAIWAGCRHRSAGPRTAPGRRWPRIPPRPGEARVRRRSARTLLERRRSVSTR
jgi:hypothetical protein